MLDLLGLELAIEDVVESSGGTDTTDTVVEGLSYKFPPRIGGKEVDVVVTGTEGRDTPRLDAAAENAF